jgi:hypothetical protein
MAVIGGTGSGVKRSGRESFVFARIGQAENALFGML